MQRVIEIKTLLKEEKYSIAGARQVLARQEDGAAIGFLDHCGLYQIFIVMNDLWPSEVQPSTSRLKGRR